MEYCDIGSLSDMIRIAKRTFTEKQIAKILQTCVSALSELHSIGIIHRDIKCRNVMISNYKIMLGDFGASAFEKNPRKKRHDCAGTPLWMSPEMISGNGHTSKTDIWSLGIMIIEMAEGIVPHWDLEPEQAFVSIVDGPPPKLSNESNWSDKMKHFLSVCLRKDPRTRPTAKKLLTHPFIALRKNSSYFDLVSGIDQTTWREWQDGESWLSATQQASEAVRKLGKQKAMGIHEGDKSGKISRMGASRKITPTNSPRATTMSPPKAAKTCREATWSKTVKCDSVVRINDEKSDSLWENAYSLKFLSANSINTKVELDCNEEDLSQDEKWPFEFEKEISTEAVEANGTLHSSQNPLKRKETTFSATRWN
eukprot:TRINITY_DN12190_c0_g1_i1.p1 TRINITY_DN12190_c0_g1~~TRINITY_DN12190_c0_g1_i1.p1  ORF type:complete len:367 (-),score=55.63 TRINITY_DN12190_c0_g1_i1:309-1409(-)